MIPITLKINLDNQSDTKVAAAQTLGGAGNFVLTAAATSGIDSSGAARFLKMTTTDDESAVHFTIAGTDADGNSITETITGVNNTTTISVKAYKTVTTIASDGAVASNMSWGTANATRTAVSKTVPLDFYNRIASQVALEITGTETVSVLETFDPILSAGTGSAVFMAGPTGLTSQAATTHGQADVGVTGLQVKVVSYTNGATFTAQIISPNNSNLG